MAAHRPLKLLQPLLGGGHTEPWVPGPGLALPSWSQPKPCLRSAALSSIHTTYIFPNESGFRGGREPEVLPGSPCHAASSWEETT